MKFGMKVGFGYRNKTCVLDFWYFEKNCHFWWLLRNILPILLKITKILCNNHQKWTFFSKYQKSKTQVLFLYPNPTFMPNFMKIRWNGEELIHFEGFFYPGISLIIPYSLMLMTRFLRKVPRTPKVTVSQPFGVERWLSPFWKLYEQGYHLRKYKRELRISLTYPKF